MSVIAGKVYKDRIDVAADSISVRGSTKYPQLGFSKLLAINEMIIGGVGIAEETSLMYRFSQTHKPETPTEKDVLNFIVEFSGWKKDYTGSQIENHYLIAVKGHLFLVERMFVTEITDYIAIGAGEDFALAALYFGNSPTKAVEVACELSCWASAPITEYFMGRESE